MSQVESEAICRRIAVLVQVADTDLEDKVNVGVPRTDKPVPRAAVVCEQVDRVDGFIRWNRYSYSITVYVRKAWPTGDTIEQEKDALINALYDAIVPDDGNLRDADSELLAQMVPMTSADRRDYATEGKKEYDVAVTFTMQRDRLR